jgi:hypothetical protein
MKIAPMTNKSAWPETTLQKTWIAVRFIIFGVGGFLLLMFGWIATIERPFLDSERLMNPYLAFFLALVGSFMALFGVGKWGRWAYLSVLLSTPLVVSLMMVIPWPDWARGGINWGSKDMGVLIFALPLIVSNLIVRRYYRRRDARNAPAPHEDLSVSASGEQTSK